MIDKFEIVLPDHAKAVIDLYELAYKIRKNADAQDDDLADTWDDALGCYRKLKHSLDEYFGENDE